MFVTRAAHWLTSSLAATGVLMAGGCLEVRSGHRADATEAADTQIQTADTQPTAGDTGLNTTPDTGPDTASGCSAGCDDGDPCTDDGCVLGQCQHDAVAGCDPGCNAVNDLPLSSAVYTGPGEGTQLTTHGVVQMAQNGACLDDGICHCNAALELVDAMSSQSLQLGRDPTTMVPPGGGAPMAYGCSSQDDASTPNKVRVECEPMRAGVAYRVWGAASYGDAKFAGAAVARMPYRSLGVDGYCLDTSSDENLWGDYAGRIDFDPPSQVSVALHARIWSVDQGELIELRPDDPNSTFLGVTGSPVERLDNGLRFDFDLGASAPPLGAEPVIARVTAVGNHLEGTFVSTWAARGPKWGYTGISNMGGPAAPADGASHPHAQTPPADVAPRPAASGRIVLERLGPSDGVRSPCANTPF